VEQRRKDKEAKRLHSKLLRAQSKAEALGVSSAGSRGSSSHGGGKIASGAARSRSQTPTGRGVRGSGAANELLFKSFDSGGGGGGGGGGDDDDEDLRYNDDNDDDGEEDHDEDDEDDDDAPLAGDGSGRWRTVHGRVLRRWASAKVEGRGYFVHDLFVDLRDGEVSLHVLNSLSWFLCLSTFLVL